MPELKQIDVRSFAARTEAGMGPVSVTGTGQMWRQPDVRLVVCEGGKRPREQLAATGSSCCADRRLELFTVGLAGLRCRVR